MRLYLKDTGGYGLDSGWSAHSEHTPLSQESPVSTIAIRKLTLLSFFRTHSLSVNHPVTVQDVGMSVPSSRGTHTLTDTSTCIYVPTHFACLPTTSLIHLLFPAYVEFLFDVCFGPEVKPLCHCCRLQSRCHRTPTHRILLTT